MQYSERYFPKWGHVLWITDGKIEIGVALDFGIRIVHLSCVACENIFYEQPIDCSDGYTEGQWRLYGGHRLWLAPESQNSYHPDNTPVRYRIQDERILFEQDLDPLLMVYKRLLLSINHDGTIKLVQLIENASDQIISGAAWGINTLDCGGAAEIAFSCVDCDSLNPQRIVSLWSNTNLHDPRLRFTKDSLVAQHLPMMDDLKLGLYSNPGTAVFKNKGQRFVLSYETDDLAAYPDCGCNFELYMCKQFMELESLGKYMKILPGQSAIHTEIWQLYKCD